MFLKQAYISVWLAFYMICYSNSELSTFAARSYLKAYAEIPF